MSFLAEQVLRTPKTMEVKDIIIDCDVWSLCCCERKINMGYRPCLQRLTTSNKLGSGRVRRVNGLHLNST